MRIVIVGAGGVGGYFGARLAAAGDAVAFVARGSHGDAIRARGLAVRSPLGDVTVAPATVVDDVAGHGPADAVVVAVKMYDLAGAAALLPPLVGPHTLVVPLQNGIEAEDLLEPGLPDGAVAGALCQIAVHIEAPGVIRHGGDFARVIVGARHPGQEPRIAALLSRLRAAGVAASEAPDIERALWEKFVFLSAMAGACCLYRAPIGAIRGEPDRHAVLARLVAEAVAVGRARGVALPTDQAERTLAFVGGLPAGMKASMLHDLEAGRRLELAWLNGAVARLAAAAGLAAPAHDEVCAALAPFADGRR